MKKGKGEGKSGTLDNKRHAAQTPLHPPQHAHPANAFKSCFLVNGFSNTLPALTLVIDPNCSWPLKQ